eukprot:gene12927-biopygen15540
MPAPRPRHSCPIVAYSQCHSCPIVANSPRHSCQPTARGKRCPYKLEECRWTARQHGLSTHAHRQASNRTGGVRLAETQIWRAGAIPPRAMAGRKKLQRTVRQRQWLAQFGGQR